MTTRKTLEDLQVVKYLDIVEELLTPREFLCLKRYLNGEKLREIAPTFDISNERVRGIINKSIRKIWHHRSNSLKIEQLWTVLQCFVQLDNYKSAIPLPKKSTKDPA